MKSRILVIDDDEKLNELLTGYFNNFNLETYVATHPDEGFKKLKTTDPDLIILDVMLPDMDGFEVLKKIRKSSSVPIIMLTARGDITDKVVGLEIGADDYLAKPFEPRELVARVQSVLRRSAGVQKQSIKTFHNLTVNFETRTAELDQIDLNLTTNEYQTLAFLIENKGKVLDRDQIMDHLRGIECDAFNRSVDIAMSRLRQKLKDDPKNPRLIKTVWGAGYLFIGEET